MAGAAMARAGGMRSNSKPMIGGARMQPTDPAATVIPTTALARPAFARAVVAMMVGQGSGHQERGRQDRRQRRPTRQGDGQQDGCRAAEHGAGDQLAVGQRRGQDAAQQPPNQHDGPEPGDRLDGNPLGCSAVLEQIEVHKADQSGFGQHVEEDDGAPPQHAGPAEQADGLRRIGCRASGGLRPGGSLVRVRSADSGWSQTARSWPAPAPQPGYRRAASSPRGRQEYPHH